MNVTPTRILVVFDSFEFLNVLKFDSWLRTSIVIPIALSSSRRAQHKPFLKKIKFKKSKLVSTNKRCNNLHEQELRDTEISETKVSMHLHMCVQPSSNLVQLCVLCLETRRVSRYFPGRSGDGQNEFGVRRSLRSSGMTIKKSDSSSRRRELNRFNVNENDHSVSWCSVHTAPTSPQGQSASALARSIPCLAKISV